MTRRISAIQRLLHGICYSALALLGLVGLVQPPNTVVSVAPGLVYLLWASPLVVGGLMSLWAVITDRPFFEMIGLPNLMGGLVIYAYGLSYRLASDPRGNAVGIIVVIAVMASLVVLLLDRLLEANRLLRTFGGRR